MKYAHESRLVFEGPQSHLRIGPSLSTQTSSSQAVRSPRSLASSSIGHAATGSVRAIASNAATLMAMRIMGQICAFGPARQRQAKRSRAAFSRSAVAFLSIKASCSPRPA